MKTIDQAEDMAVARRRRGSVVSPVVCFLKKREKK